MKPEQFIREYGVEKARELLNADSDFKTYCLIDKSFWSESEGTCSFCVDLDDLKRLVESLDLVESYKGIGEARWYVRRWFKLHAGCKHVKSARTYITEQLSALQHAIAVHESIYGGGDE